MFTGARPEDADVSAVDLLEWPRVLLHVLQQVIKATWSTVGTFILLLMTATGTSQV